MRIRDDGRKDVLVRNGIIDVSRDIRNTVRINVPRRLCSRSLEWLSCGLRQQTVM